MGIGKGYSENVSIDEGLDENGVRTIIHFEGDELIIQKQQDMEAVFAHVDAMRRRNEGKPWGDGKEVGYIPPLFYDKICTIVDKVERRKAVKRFFQQNPRFCAYEAYLK